MTQTKTPINRGSVQTSLNTTDLVNTIERIRPSIMQIVASFEFRLNDGSLITWKCSGTGFLIDQQGHVATAAHVVGIQQNSQLAYNQYLQQGKQIVPTTFVRKNVSVYAAIPSINTQHRVFYGNFTGEDASIFKEDDTQDITILTVKSNPLTSGSFRSKLNGITIHPIVPTFQMDIPQEGTPISMSGFPLSIPVLVTTNGWLATSFFRDDRGRSLCLGDIQVNHGNSGGPIYLSRTGAVIGMAVEYEPSPEGNSGLTVIVPIRSVMAQMSSEKSF